MTFEESVAEIRAEVADLLTADQRVEVPEFRWDGPIARWQRRHQWATFSVSPETGPQFGYLLVLGRNPDLRSPLGAQSTPLPFALSPEVLSVIAHAITDHFLWPA